MTDVFISYKKEQKAQAEALARVLERQNLRVWWAENLETSAEAFHIQIWRELQRARAVVVLWSPEAMQSRWVISEADYAFNTRKLINAQISNVQLMPPFSGLQVADLRNWGGSISADGFKRITHQVSRMLAPIPGKPDTTVGSPRAPAPRSPRPPPAPRSPTGPRIFVDSGGGPGVKSSIQAAIDQAPEGAVIEIAPRLYREALVIRKRVTLLGIANGMERPRIMGPGGGRDGVVINGDCEIENLILSQPDASCVIWVQDGAPRLSRLLVESRGEPPEDRNGAAIYVGGAAEPHASKVSVGPCCSSGIFFANFGGGRWSNIRIQNSNGAGIYLAHDSAPVIDGLQILKPKAAAIVATNTAKGVLTNIDISRSDLPAIVLRERANPTFRQGVVTDVKSNGIQVNDDAQGVFESFTLRRCGRDTTIPAVWIDTRAAPQLRQPQFFETTATCIYRDNNAPKAVISGAERDGQPLVA